MTEDIHRLVYYSRNRIPGDERTAGEIRDILIASRRNNTATGVTGALMFNSGCFAQVLEGSRDAVENTFERIQQDPRHGEVSLLAFEPVPDRVFPSWSMAFVGERNEDQARFGGIAGESGYDPSRMSADALFKTLRKLVFEEEQSPG